MTDSKDIRAVVVGSGRTDLRTARLLDERGHNVVIIERNPERVRTLVEDHNVTVIEGDATNPDILG